MMKKYLILSCMLISLQGMAQTYTPFNLDTTSFWKGGISVDILDLNFFNVQCHGETMTYVEKDTIINSEQYFILKTYTTSISKNGGYQCNGIFPNGTKMLLKEDTTNESITYIRTDGLMPDTSIISFNHIAGDTMYEFKSILFAPVVDSVVFENYNGVLRKTLYVHSYNPMFNFKIIAGIGSLVNFPLPAYLEFGYPASSLNCFSKQGITLYGNINMPCQKSPPLPIGIVDQNKNTAFEIITNENLVAITNNNSLKLSLDICNLFGQTICHDVFFDSRKNFDMKNFVAGIYIISVTNEKEKITKKFVVN